MKTKTIMTALFAGLLFAPAPLRAADNGALMEPVKSVYDHYLAIQTELAKDSVKGVDEHANAIAKAVKGDEMKMLSPDVAKQAETLAKAKDLKAAREAFIGACAEFRQARPPRHGTARVGPRCGFE